MENQIDELAGRAMKAFNVPGMAITVIKDGRVIYANGYGVRSLASPGQVDTNTLFGIASGHQGFYGCRAWHPGGRGKTEMER
jgi:CubicO group peptidase (beta-lactamase class C family)